MLLALALVAGAGLGGGGGERRRASGPAREDAVARVVDGDTVILAALGRSRLIGVDTPEVHGRRECFGEQASAFTKRLLARQPVRYALGAQARDSYGRALVYLWLADGRFVNELLVAGGYARALQIAPNVRHAQLLRRQARVARTAGRGLWSHRACPAAVEVG